MCTRTLFSCLSGEAFWLLLPSPLFRPAGSSRWLNVAAGNKLFPLERVCFPVTLLPKVGHFLFCLALQVQEVSYQHSSFPSSPAFLFPWSSLRSASSGGCLAVLLSPFLCHPSLQGWLSCAAAS